MKIRKFMITAAFMVAIAGALLAKSNNRKDPMLIKIDCDATCYTPVLPIPDGCSTMGSNICTVGDTTFYQVGFDACVCAWRRP
jgi:hypothetical protein